MSPLHLPIFISEHVSKVLGLNQVSKTPYHRPPISIIYLPPLSVSPPSVSIVISEHVSKVLGLNQVSFKRHPSLPRYMAFLSISLPPSILSSLA